MELWLQNWIFSHTSIWLCGDLDLWSLDLKFSEMLDAPPLSPFLWKSCYLVHLNGVMAPKMNFCPYLVLWWPQPYTHETQNLITLLYTTVNYFHQIWMNSFHAFWSFCGNKTRTDGKMEWWTTWKHNASSPLKWARS